MIELIVAHPHAFWLSLGGLLLAAEMLGGNGYLLWSGCRGDYRAGRLAAACRLGVAGRAVCRADAAGRTAVVALAEQTGEGAEAGRRASQPAWAADRG